MHEAEVAAAAARLFPLSLYSLCKDSMKVCVPVVSLSPVCLRGVAENLFVSEEASPRFKLIPDLYFIYSCLPCEIRAGEQCRFKISINRIDKREQVLRLISEVTSG